MAPVEHLLDVHLLAAPEPLLLAMNALQELSPGGYLRLRHRMKPCLLYERIGSRGFAHETRRAADGMCEVFVWPDDDAAAGRAARAAAGSLAPWAE